LIIDSEIASLADELPIELFKQEVMADFTEFVGQVFKEWDETYHVGTLQFNTNPDWQTFAAVDYGFTNPNVWLLIQVGPWGEINVLDEVYQEGLTADEFADEIRRRGLCPPSLKVFYPDPADPMSSKTLSDRLRINAAGGTGGELNIRINLMRQAMRQGRIDRQSTELTDDNADKWRPRLMMDRKCIRTRADMMAYRYPERKEDIETSRDRFELPLKRDDHGPEALGRFFAGYYGAGALTASAGTRISRGNLSRGGSRKPKVKSNTHRDTHVARMTQAGYPKWRDNRFGVVRDEEL
jgi:hypothetical protein